MNLQVISDSIKPMWHHCNGYHWLHLRLLSWCLNTLRPRQNGRHFADDIFKCIFLNENVSIAIKISLKFVPKGPIKNIPALVQVMAWRRSGDKPLSEPMMVSLPTHICVTRPQWVKVQPLVAVCSNQHHLKYLLSNSFDTSILFNIFYMNTKVFNSVA